MILQEPCPECWQGMAEEGSGDLVESKSSREMMLLYMPLYFLFDGSVTDGGYSQQASLAVKSVPVCKKEVALPMQALLWRGEITIRKKTVGGSSAMTRSLP